MSETNPWVWYSDPDVLRRERERIFRSAWHYVGHAGRLSEEPSYFACDVTSVLAFTRAASRSDDSRYAT